MTFDLPGGRRLVLAGGGLGWFWIATGLAAVVLLLVLYREERQLVSRRAGLTLLSLRMLAALVLISALFEPIAARTYEEIVRGRVIVAVDVSDSMTTADPSRTLDQRARLGKILGMSAGESVETITRREVARRLLDRPEAPLPLLERDHNLEVLAFARETAPTSLKALADTLKQPITPDDLNAQSTDWLPALEEALKGSDKDASPVIAAVVVSDGRRNLATDPGSVVDRLAARGIKVFGVLVGSTIAPRDAAIASLKAPALVYKGDVAGIEATLKLDGYSGQEVIVTLDRPGASPMRQTFRAPGEGVRPVVTFRVPLEEVGNVPLTVALAPMEGDVRPDNDRSTAVVQVLDDKARVLLVDGEPRWEFRYLRNALARDPRVALDTIVFHQPKPGLTADPVFTYGTAFPERSSTGVDPLSSFDAIVIGDVSPFDLTTEIWARLDAFASERGGTLVIVPGPRNWLSLATDPTASKLLPVLDARVVSVEGLAADPLHPSLPPGVNVEPLDATLRDASAWPMFQLADDFDETRARWQGLPGLPWAIAGRPKPGATALAAPRGDAESSLIAAQPYGLGKVLLVGTDGTWRWRYKVGDSYHHRFWGQVVRWSASGKLAAGNALVRFGPLKSRLDDGEPARIQARIAEGVPGIGPDLLIAARIKRGGSDAAVVPLRAVPGQPRVFEGIAPRLPIGSYSVTLDVPGLIEILKLASSPPEAALEIQARLGSERVELAANRDPLNRLATATDGQVLTDDEADRLPELLKATSKPTSRTEETPLWDTPGALLLFFGIITVEWIARKRVGLP